MTWEIAQHRITQLIELTIMEIMNLAIAGGQPNSFSALTLAGAERTHLGCVVCFGIRKQKNGYRRLASIKSGCMLAQAKVYLK